MEDYVIILSFDLVDLINLQKHLKNGNASLNLKIDSLSYESIIRKLTIHLTESLNETDISNLNSLLSSYVNEYEPIYKITNIGFQKMDFSNTEFTTIFVYNYQYNPDWILSQIQVSSNSTNKTDTYYTIRVVNIDTNTIIGLKDCDISNTGVAQDTLELYNNVTFKDNQLLEIQIKINGTGEISLLSVNFVFKQMF